jgi:hypothetical protein
LKENPACISESDANGRNALHLAAELDPPGALVIREGGLSIDLGNSTGWLSTVEPT